MLTGHVELFAWMLSYDCMRGAAVVLGVLSTTHGPRPMTERVSHGDCLPCFTHEPCSVCRLGLDSEENTRKRDYVQRTAPSHVAGGCGPPCASQSYIW